MERGWALTWRPWSATISHVGARGVCMSSGGRIRVIPQVALPMHRMTTMTTTMQKHQRGITLIESLVAIVIAALGILGILGVQMRTLTDTQTTVRRAQAIRLIEDLSERMKVSPNALLSIKDYESGYSEKGSALTASTCDSAACTPAEQAAYDLKQWKTTVEQTLPGGRRHLSRPG